MNPIQKFIRKLAGISDQKELNTGIFSFFVNSQAAPKMNEKDFQNAYKGWVFACVNAIASKVSDIELKYQKRLGDGTWEDLPDPDFMDVLYNVNKWYTFPQLVFLTQAYLEIEGNAFWYIPPSKGGKIIEIWPLDPSVVEVVKSKTDFIAGYIFRAPDGKKVPIAPNEMIHFKTFNPRNPYRGIGTIEAAAIPIDTNQWASEFQRNWFGNSAMPSSILTSDAPLSQEQYDRLRANWDSRYRGTDNSSKLAIIEGGLHWSPVTPTFKEMQFTESRKDLRDEILAIFRVPKPLLGITEDVNLASAETTEFVFAKEAVKPKMKAFCGFLSEFYLPLFGEGIDTRIWFNDPVPENLEQKRADIESGIKYYYMTPNEARALKGMPPVEGGDDLYVPTIVAPAGEEEEEPEPEDSEGNGEPGKEPSADSEDEPKPSEGKAFRRLPLKSKVESKKKAMRGAKIKAERQAVMQKGIAKALKTTLKWNEKLAKLIHKNIMTGKSAKKPKNRSHLQLLKDALNPASGVITIAFQGYNALADELNNDSLDNFSPVFEQAGVNTLLNMGVDATFDLKNPRAVTAMRNHALENTSSYTGTMKDEITNILIQGVDEGLSNEEIATMLGQFFDEGSQWKAERLARTETADAYGQGSLEGGKQGGATTKMWNWDQGDCESRVCPDNESQGWIPIDDSFDSGDDAEPAHPNCECWVDFSGHEELGDIAE